MLNQIERKLGRYAIPNLTIILIVGQVLCYVAAIPDPHRLDPLELIPERVMQGEFWRLLTFLFIPSLENPIFFLFGMYFLWLMGTALENHWGAFRYNVYVLIAAVLSIASAWAAPDSAATSVYIASSIFLAFAFLYPEFQIYLFFILPLKVKWVALFTWVVLAISFFVSDWPQRALIAASVTNFLLFFGADVVRMMRSRQRRMAARAMGVSTANQARRVCTVCGVTDKSNPAMEFRYCPECDSNLAYCMDHIFNHEHRGKAGEKK